MYVVYYAVHYAAHYAVHGIITLSKENNVKTNSMEHVYS